MKKTNFFVCIFICVFIFASSVKANEYSKAGDHLPQYGKKHIFMLAAEKTGSFFLRYCIENLTQMPTMYPGREDYNRDEFSYNLDLNKPCIWRCISRQYLTRTAGFISPHKDKMILLLRNYFEWGCRVTGSVDKMMDATNSADYYHYYFDNIKLYNSWTPNNRIIIYLEDLIEKPKSTLDKLLKFLGEDAKGVDAFVKEFEKHKEISLDIFEEQHCESITKGDVNFFKNILPEVEKNKINYLIRKNIPEVSSYLNRYLKK